VMPVATRPREDTLTRIFEHTRIAQ
jgi:hypothetical protein